MSIKRLLVISLILLIPPCIFAISITGGEVENPFPSVENLLKFDFTPTPAKGWKNAYLVTVDGGSEVYSYFGHSGIIIEEDGEGTFYDWGNFSFSDGFYRNFLFGLLYYSAGRAPAKWRLSHFENSDRTITILPLKLDQGDAFFEMFQVVIQLGAILAVVVIYFHKLNPFSPTKTQKQKMMTWQIWIKVIIGCLPAGVIGLLFDNWIDKTLYHWYVVALMLIVYGVLFIVVENYQKGKEPRVTKFSQLTIPMILIIGVFQMLAMIPGTSRSGATIVGALMIGVSRSLAAEYTFFLAIPVMFGASLLKLVKFGFNFTTIQLVVLLVGMVVSFAVSIVAIKFLMSYIRKNDFKVFGYYRIVLGVIVFLFFGIQTLLA